MVDDFTGSRLAAARSNAEFTADTQHLARTGFIDAFVNRPAFQAAFSSVSNDTYVDSLIAHPELLHCERARGFVDGLSAAR